MLNYKLMREIHHLFSREAPLYMWRFYEDDYFIEVYSPWNTVIRAFLHIDNKEAEIIQIVKDCLTNLDSRRPEGAKSAIDLEHSYTERNEFKPVFYDDGTCDDECEQYYTIFDLNKCLRFHKELKGSKRCPECIAEYGEKP